MASREGGRLDRNAPPRRVRAFGRGLLATLLCLLIWCAAAPAGTYRAFNPPQVVSINGYSGSAMEPFVSPDGRYLLFNTSNVAPNVPSLQLATRIDATTYEYGGELQGQGVNEAGSLSGTPSMDAAGELYFISNRSYFQTLSTVYTGQFAEGHLSGVHLAAGVAGAALGFVDFDVSVSPDGSRLYVSVGNFQGGGAPSSASIAIFDKVGAGFLADPLSSQILQSVNAGGQLDYAPCVSGDGLELYFTRVDPAQGTPAIYRAVRKKLNRPFAHVQRVAAITGFAEAPSLSADGRTLYFHELVGNSFEIQSVTRP